MTLTARNQFQGTVTRIAEGQAMAEVAVKVGNLEFIAAITEGSVKNMGLTLNDSVTVAVTANEVRIGKWPAWTFAESGLLPWRRLRKAGAIAARRCIIQLRRHCE